MSHDSYADDHIRSVLDSVKTIAVVGASPNADRPSNEVMHFLARRGYRVIPVNPGQVGREEGGLTYVGSLADIKEPIDMVDVFRRSELVGPVVEEALALDPLPKVIWMQLGVRNDAAAATAEAKGVTVIMNRCPKIEIARLRR